MSPDSLPLSSPRESDEAPRGVQTTEGRVFTGLPYGCPKLDWRVRIETAVAFIVTYRLAEKLVGKVVWCAETYNLLRDAIEFHDSLAPELSGVVIALREDGSVIGEVPTRRQEQAILARARKADLDYIGDLAIGTKWGRRG